MRTALGLPATREWPTAGLILTIRERSLFRAATRRRLRAATALAGITLSGLAALGALGMTFLYPERQGQMLALYGTQGLVGIGATVIALGRWRLPPLPLVFVLTLSTVLLGIQTLAVVPESGTTSLMLLAAIPPAVALFVPWGVRFHVGWLLAGASALAAFTVCAAGAAVPAAVWGGEWLVLVISALASLVGCVGASSRRQRAFEDQMRARRAHAGTVAREAELERLNGKLAWATRTDPLTGLGNRLRLDEELATCSAWSSRYGDDCALVLLDLDRFKGYNDALGHVAGDAALRAVAATLQAHARAVDTVCRYGGEEFVVLMPGQTLAAAAGAAERLRIAVEGLGLHYPAPMGARPLTISAGVAVLGRGASLDPDEVVRAADAALYRAKGSGRNQVVVMSPDRGRSVAGRRSSPPRTRVRAGAAAAEQG
jgi:diguanylate cyclase (GGDEF)-like protein